MTGVEISRYGSPDSRRSPESVAEIAMAALARFEQVPQNAQRRVPPKLISMVAVLASEASKVEPLAGFPDPRSADDTVVWVVRAEGEFIGLRGPPGTGPVTKDSGFFVIEDVTGLVRQTGMP
jgi:hypothetical protein